MKTNKNSNTIAAVIGTTNNYLSTERFVRRIIQRADLQLASLPMVAQGMKQKTLETALLSLEGRKIRRAVATTSYEHIGSRDDDIYYEVWHGAGSLAENKGLKYHLKRIPWNDAAAYKQRANGFLKEWNDVAKGTCDGTAVARYHIDDLKKGLSPKADEPHTVFVNLGTYKFTTGDAVGYDAFMKDDRALMACGSEEHRTTIGDCLKLSAMLQTIFADVVKEKGQELQQHSPKSFMDVRFDGGRQAFFDVVKMAGRYPYINKGYTGFLALNGVSGIHSYGLDYCKFSNQYLWMRPELLNTDSSRLQTKVYQTPAEERLMIIERFDDRTRS